MRKSKTAPTALPFTLFVLSLIWHRLYFFPSELQDSGSICKLASPHRNTLFLNKMCEDSTKPNREQQQKTIEHSVELC